MKAKEADLVAGVIREYMEHNGFDAENDWCEDKAWFESERREAAEAVAALMDGGEFVELSDEDAGKAADVVRKHIRASALSYEDMKRERPDMAFADGMVELLKGKMAACTEALRLLGA